jgi:hypothetical protein
MQAAYWATTDTKVAACLCTVGVQIRVQDPISRVMQRGRETWHYWFELGGANGVSTAEIAQAIIEGQDQCETLRDKLPDLPGARAALFNRETLLDLGNNKCRQLVFVNLPNGGVMLSDRNLSAETKRQVAQLAL